MPELQAVETLLSNVPKAVYWAALLGLYGTLSNLDLMGVIANPAITSPMKTTLLVWHSVRAHSLEVEVTPPSHSILLRILLYRSTD